MKCNCQLANRCVHAEPVERSVWRRYLRDSLRVSALAVPGVLLMLLCRLAYAKAAGWGW